MQTLTTVPHPILHTVGAVVVAVVVVVAIRVSNELVEQTELIIRQMNV